VQVTDSFVEFLLRAKKRTYASQGDDASVPPLLEGARQLEYAEGEFLYRDIYFGMKFFVGQETVYVQGKPVWSMSYAGGVAEGEEDAREVYAFLRKAMRQVTPERPYRGPESYREGVFQYSDRHTGGLDHFSGVETIERNGRQVYKLHYSGGFLR
jgi:hypothetical protein